MAPDRSRARAIALLALTATTVLGCFDDSGVKSIAQTFGGGPRPDELPVMLTKEPFRYPPELYAQKAQGNVTLRVFIDRDGRVHPESTVVETSSGYTALDSAAVKGAAELRFVPAKKNGEPMDISILVPVYYRHRDAAPLPGDTILKQAPAPSKQP